MNHVHRQNQDGSWSPAEPLGMQGWKGKLEERLRGWGLKRLPNLLARWDERGLG